MTFFFCDLGASLVFLALKGLAQAGELPLKLKQVSNSDR